MAFCRFCGRELADGEECPCQTQSSSSIPTTPSSIQPQQIISLTWSDFLQLLKHPSSSGRAYIYSGNIISPVIFLLLQGICSGIFSILCIGKINGLVALGGSFTENLKFSAPGAFFLTLFYSLLLSAVLLGLFLGLSKLFRFQLTVPQALCIISMRSVILIPITLFNCLVFLLNIPAGIVCFYFIGALSGVDFLYAGAETALDSNPNRKVYLMLVVTVLFTLIFLIFGSWALPSYVPSSIRDLFSWEGILNQLSSM